MLENSMTKLNMWRFLRKKLKNSIHITLRSHMDVHLTRHPKMSPKQVLLLFVAARFTTLSIGRKAN